MRSHLSLWWAIVGVSWATMGIDSGFAADLPTNNNPHRQIRFSSADEAEQRRQQLVELIWRGGLPLDRQPAVETNVGPTEVGDHLARLDATLFKQVDRLEIDVRGMISLAYLLHPRQTSDKSRLAIVHEGHAPRDRPLHDGIDATVQYFLQQGFNVCILQMPLYGWNSDETMVLTDSSASDAAEATEVSVKRHDEMFDVFSAHGLPAAEAMQLFLEPVVMAVNYWIKTTNSHDITLIGLSGGAWTTHMCAAMDPRIRLSIPVAGSYPLYLRNINPDWVGDREQYFLLSIEHIVEGSADIRRGSSHDVTVHSCPRRLLSCARYRSAGRTPSRRSPQLDPSLAVASLEAGIVFERGQFDIGGIGGSVQADERMFQNVCHAPECGPLNSAPLDS